MVRAERNEHTRTATPRNGRTANRQVHQASLKRHQRTVPCRSSARSVSLDRLRSRTMPPIVADQPECWPSLPLNSWKETYATLHMWTQMVGKVRLRLTPLVNHWWNVPVYVSVRRLTTSRLSYGQTAFELWFDFIQHQLVLETSDGIRKTLPLAPRSVAEFYQEFMAMLRSAGIDRKSTRLNSS